MVVLVADVVMAVRRLGYLGNISELNIYQRLSVVSVSLMSWRVSSLVSENVSVSEKCLDSITPSR